MTKQRVEEIRVEPGVAMNKFRRVLEDVFQEHGLSVPSELSAISGRVMGTSRQGGPSYGTQRDIDIVMPEPSGVNLVTLSQIEQEVRRRVGASGVDFSFAPPDEMEDLKHVSKKIRR